ncbi:MAG: terminase large subunit [Lachnospiraceae bacterium]|nr:terminase large subunit [Lachnospiraceae bacterium]
MQISETTDRVTRFAERNLHNKKEFGTDARLAFKRHMDDMKKAVGNDPSFPFIFVPEKAEDIIELANKLTIAEGEGGKAFICAGFQEFILGSLFGWVHKETGKRRFLDSYVQVSRQQGKSILNAILGIKCSNFDGYSQGQVYCTATKSDQARIVLKEIEKFINADADLQELFNIKDYKNEITAKITGSVIKALGRDTKSIDGFRPYLGIVDEYHAHKDNQMYKLLKGGTRNLEQSLVSVITTAGLNLNAPCYELYQYCRRVLRGVDINDRQFIYIAQMDEEDDIWDGNNWIKCCPLTGNNAELMSQMEEDAKKALSIGGAELLDFMTKSLNIWVKDAETSFINLKDWEKCGGTRTLEDFRRQKAVCGLDLSSGGDLTSLVLEFPYTDKKTGDKKYYLYSHSFMPKRRLQEHMDMEDNAPYVIWVNEGLVTVTTAASGIKTDYKAVLLHLSGLIDEYDIELDAICYDPSNSGAFLADLEDFGCELIEITQSAKSLNDATVDFQLEVKAHNIEYNENNRLLTRSMNDAVLTTPNIYGNVKIDKNAQKHRIDPCDAAICAHKKAMTAEVEEVTADQSVEAYLKMFGKEDKDRQ